MVSNSFKRFGTAALDFTARVIFALWTAAAHNRRTTAFGLAGFIAVSLAPYGYALSPDGQLRLAKFLIIVIGVVAGDQLNRRKRR